MCREITEEILKLSPVNRSKTRKVINDALKKYSLAVSRQELYLDFLDKMKTCSELRSEYLHHVLCGSDEMDQFILELHADKSLDPDPAKRLELLRETWNQHRG